MSLTGKVAVVTGASQGIGEATARMLAESGVHLVLASRDPDRLEATVAAVRRPGIRVRGVVTDVRDANAVDRLFAVVDHEFAGRLDVIVNSAGVCYLSPLADLEVAEFDEMLATNVRGTFLCNRGAIPRLRAAGGGHIVNLSSAVTTRVPPRVGGYGASKAAIDGMSEALAAELSPDGIRVHTIAPTFVDTPMRRRLFPDGDSSFWFDAREVARTICFVLDQDPLVLVEGVRLVPARRVGPQR